MQGSMIGKGDIYQVARKFTRGKNSVEKLAQRQRLPIIQRKAIKSLTCASSDEARLSFAVLSATRRFSNC